MALNLNEFDHYEIYSGKKGTNRKIKWVHIVELANLNTTFNGGELILTTGKKWITKEKYAVPFLKKVINSDCACLCIELHTEISNIPQELFTISEKHQFPIIIFHNRVKFMEISRAIYDFIYSKTSPIDSVLLNQIWSMEEDINVQLSPIYNDNNGGVFLFVNDKAETVSDFFKKELLNIQIFKTFIASANATLVLLTFNKNNIKNKIIEILKNLNNSDTYNILVSPFFYDQSSLFDAVKKLKILTKIAQEFSFSTTTFYDEVHIEKVLYLLDCKYLEQLTDEYLGPLIAYDKKSNSELTLTLKTLIELNGNRNETAKRLFISRQAIYYRINMIKKILSENFDQPNKKAMLELLLYNYFNRTLKNKED